MRRVIPFIALSLALAGCQIERFFADDVGAGVARLSVRTAGALTALIEADTNCGFSSEQVKIAVDGTPGHLGTVSFVVTDCEIRFPDLTEVDRDCNDNAMRAQGTAVVNATRVVAGTLTGDANNPVIPATSDSVTIRIEAGLTNFHVERDDNPAILQVHEGAIAFTAKPRLAVGSKAPGVCSVATPNVTLEGLRLSRAAVGLFDGVDREFPVDVVTSDIFAQIGVGPGGQDENFIEGFITVWDSNVALSSDTTLDGNYTPESFVRGYSDAACLDAQEPLDDRIAAPVSFECEGVDAVVADGAARLLVQDLGMIAQLVEADASCGFSTVAASVEGTPGAVGRASWSVSECAIQLPQNTVLSTDCAGNPTFVGGRVVVTATKTIEGWLSGSELNPAVPMSDTPARIVIQSARMEGFTVGSPKGALTLQTGTLAGVVEPRTAVGVATQACSVSTKHARISELSFDGPALAGVASPQGQFEIDLVAAQIDATNGRVGAGENAITGSITVGTETYALDELPSGNTLDASYDAIAFESSFSCDEELQQPLSYQCNFDEVLAGGLARLSVNALAQVATAIEANTECGFSSDAAIANANVNGELGRDGGDATFNVTSCELDFTTPLALGQDCNGAEVSLQGRATVTGTKTLRGIVSGDPNEPIVPSDWDPATISLSVDFDQLTVRSTGMPQGLEVVQGTLSGTLAPRTALDTTTGACSEPTPTAAIDLSWSSGAVLKLLSGENSILGYVDGADLSAVNGKRDADENELLGELVLGGRSYDVSGPLNPDYDASTFVDAFACKPNLRVPQNIGECDFKQTLVDGASRLVIQAVGEVARSANAEGGCAFSGLGVLMDPLSVIGDVGQQGSMTFEIGDCELGPNPFEDGPELISEDCTGIEKYHQGLFTVNAQRHVTGEREEINFLFINADSIIPNSRDAVTVTLQEILFNEFRPFHLNPDGTSADPGVLTLHTGSLSGVVRPVLGENSGTLGRFDVPTPVSALDDIRLQNAEVTLEAQGKTFKFSIEDSTIDAFNGSFGGRQNEISGHMIIDGVRVDIAGGGLDPEFSQGEFDAGYSCNEDLVDIIRP